MDLNTAYEAFLETISKLATAFPAKALISAILAIFLQKHFYLFLGFSALVFLDAFTRWMAITHDYLVEIGDDDPNIFEDIRSIPKARAAGRISSTKMKERGLGKIAVYVICAIVAAIGDLMMSEIGTPPWLINLVIGYLVATEALSVVENLAAAGAENMGKLLGKIKGRL